MENLLNLTGLQFFLTCVFLLATGIAECFFGYKIVKGVMLAIGLCSGASFGYNLSNVITSQFEISGNNKFFMLVGLIIVCALLFSLLAYRFYLAGTFITNGFIAFVLIYSMFISNGIPSIVPIILSIVSGIAVGWVSVKLFKPYKIVSSSLMGGFLVSLAVYTFFKNRFGDIITIIPGLIFFILGVIFQFKSNAEHFSASKKHHSE